MTASRLFFCTSLLVCFSQLTFGQSDLPVLKTNTEDITIKDGPILRTDYWTVSPEIELDVYIADKYAKPKVVSFYSDIDSISFEVKPYDQFDFIILLNGKDTCYTQIKSGLAKLEDTSLTQAADTIPFQLTEANNISIEAILNKEDTVNLMFHTASNSVGLISKVVDEIAKLDMDNSVTGNAWGGTGTARYSKNNHLQIGDFSWDGLVVWESRHSGPDTDGKFGLHLFDHKVLEINYDEKALIIHHSLPQLPENTQQMDLVFNQDMMFLEGILEIDGHQIQNQFLIHSGYSGALLVDDEFANENQLGEKLEIISESELQDSYGNKMKTKKAILPALHIGKSDFSEVPISFFEGSIGRQKMSVIGGQMLRRFNLFLDLQKAQIYFQPNSQSTIPFSDS